VVSRGTKLGYPLDPAVLLRCYAVVARRQGLWLLWQGLNPLQGERIDGTLHPGMLGHRRSIAFRPGYQEEQWVAGHRAQHAIWMCRMHAEVCCIRFSRGWDGAGHLGIGDNVRIPVARRKRPRIISEGINANFATAGRGRGNTRVASDGCTQDLDRLQVRDSPAGDTMGAWSSRRHPCVPPVRKSYLCTLVGFRPPRTRIFSVQASRTWHLQSLEAPCGATTSPRRNQEGKVDRLK
jgi:hypothetical protein